MLAVSGRAYKGHEGIRQWRVEVHRVAPGPDGRVAIVMTMHFRGKESGAALSERTGHVWTLRNGRLLRNEPHREPEEALRALGLSP